MKYFNQHVPSSFLSLEIHDEIYGNDESKTLNVAVLDW